MDNAFLTDIETNAPKRKLTIVRRPAARQDDVEGNAKSDSCAAKQDNTQKD